MLCLAWTALGGQDQIRINIIEKIPNLARDFQVRDWRATAYEFDRLAFDLSARGEHLPLAFLIQYGNR